MRNQFEIHCSDTGTTLIFSSDVARSLDGHEGWTYEVGLDGGPLSASAVVYDMVPQRWTEFARDWRGWAGEKTCESLEGHLRISATSDELGHISLRVELGDVQAASDWRAETSLFLEAGQLESMAKEARNFFSGD